jgi:hypothetical protein
MRRSVPGALVDPAASLPEGPVGSGPPPAQPGEPRLRTEFDFVLPRGYVDDDGRLHRSGTMRLATARDELLPLYDARVQENPAFTTVVLLSRVITSLGSLTSVSSTVIENMFASDVAFLQDLYRRVNAEGHTRVAVACPACAHRFEVDVSGGRLGES